MTLPKGYKHTEETKRKMSISNKGKTKGNKHYLYGKHRSIETKLKISEKLKGKILSEENKKKLIASHKGKHLSKETKRKISKSQTGKIGYWKGKKLSAETKLKLSIANKGHIPWIKGKHFSEETKLKMSKSHKTPEFIEGIKKRLAKKGKSLLELKFENIIKKHNLPYKFVGDGKFSIANKIPDFINTNGEKIAIEVYYRKHKEYFKEGLLKWKQERQILFNEYGYKTIFFDETEVREDIVLERLTKT